MRVSAYLNKKEENKLTVININMICFAYSLK